MAYFFPNNGPPHSSWKMYEKCTRANSGADILCFVTKITSGKLENRIGSTLFLTSLKLHNLGFFSDLDVSHWCLPKEENQKASIVLLNRKQIKNITSIVLVIVLIDLVVVMFIRRKRVFARQRWMQSVCSLYQRCWNVSLCLRRRIRRKRLRLSRYIISMFYSILFCFAGVSHFCRAYFSAWALVSADFICLGAHWRLFSLFCFDHCSYLYCLITSNKLIDWLIELLVFHIIIHLTMACVECIVAVPFIILVCRIYMQFFNIMSLACGWASTFPAVVWSASLTDW